MSAIVGFNDLKVGQRVKVKGKSGEDGKFTALEVNIKPSEDGAALEGKVQGVDTQKNTIRLLFRDIAMQNGVVIKNIQRNDIGLKDLKADDVIKVKGAYSAAKGFVPEKIKMQEARGFNIEEMQGQIDSVDQAGKMIEVLGVAVQISEKTEIEGI